MHWMALTRKEWEEIERAKTHQYNMAPMIHDQARIILDSAIPQINRPMAMAALCLHEQPFGFTRDDVETLRALADDPDNYNPEACNSLADRIDGLLPPEKL